MKEISKWLMDVEGSAKRFYEKAALKFAEDAELSQMLKLLAEDEARHYCAVKLIHDITLGTEEFDSAIVPDAASMNDTLSLFAGSEKKLDSGGMTKEELLNAVINIETSEHNDFFLYAIKVSRFRMEGLLKDASDISRHRAHIERFINVRPEFGKLCGKLSRLPVSGRENMLVVDDDASLTEAFHTLLSEYGAVDTASNGKEALEKLAGKYYAAIISDIRMPVMSGIEFFEKAVQKFPSVKNRFIFLTNYDEECKDFFEKNSLRHLEKPAPMSEIKEAVKNIFSAARH
ncbi:MAG: response regulator [Deltaproteobacteria bacterium]|nr:response regulator [Deltaproteobacteria bacterium]